ncbi:MAG: InlB B-repeat-containing protein, partial [Acetatifactor sp.]
MRKNKFFRIVTLLFMISFLVCGLANTCEAASNFDITVKAITTGQGKAKISWKDSYDYQDKYFRVWRREEGESDSITVGIDYENVDKIRVLNIYPNDESGSTSNQKRYFKWLKKLPAVTKSTGETVNIVRDFKVVNSNGSTTDGTKQDVHSDGLLSITACSLGDFNENASKILKKSSGKWNYDVVVFGFNDGNKLSGHAYVNGKDGSNVYVSGGISGALNRTGYNAVSPFIEDGNGVIFGHDVLVNNLYNSDISYGERSTYTNANGVPEEMWTGYHIKTASDLNTYHNYFNDLAKKAGVKIVNEGALGKPSKMAANMYVTVEHDGLFNRYPYDLGDEDTKISLNGKLSHTLGAVYDSSLSSTRTWLKFSLPCADGKTPAYFLVTRNNCAVIQTGHSNDDTSTDEQKILANLTFYCNQLLFNKGTFTDPSAKDKAEPEKPSVSITRSGTKATLTCAAEDNGTAYTYYVEAYEKNDTQKNTKVAQSKEASTTVATGVSYYKYLIDTESENDKASVIKDGKKSNDGKISYTVDKTQRYLHVVAVDGAGNVGKVKNVKLPINVEHLLTVNPNGGTWENSTAIQKFEYVEGEARTILDAKPQPQVGKKFTKWNFSTASGSTTTFDASTKMFTMGSMDATLKAQYEYIQYNLAYDFAGGAGADGGSYPAKATYNSSFTVTPPMRTGHTFTGWTITGMNDKDINENKDRHYYSTTNSYSNVNSAYGVESCSIGAQFIWFKNLRSTLEKEDASEATVTFTAGWKKNEYTLTVKPNGGSWNGSTDNQTFKLLYQDTKTIAAPARTGYTFTGWTLAGSGSSMNGTTFTMGAENATLTANWKVNSYTLTVNPNGGTWNGSTSNQKFTLNYGTTKTIAAPTRKGFTFTGWTLTGSGSSMNGTTFTMGAENATLTAKWQRNEYTLLVNPNGGRWNGSTDNQAFRLLYEEEKEISDPVRSGYTFTGWTLTGEGSIVSGNTFKMGWENATLLANWEANRYIIRFDGNGATEGEMEDFPMIYDIPRNLPENAFIRETDEGESRFMGWSMDSGKRTGDYADKEEV